jgi:hypothetical protein
MKKDGTVINNQIFIGLPWKTTRPKYDRITPELEKKYPIHFTVVGRNDNQNADDLLEIIKLRLASSSFAVFDATGGNANVSLEFGYAEAISMQMALYVCTHGAASKAGNSPIISDLAGKRRIQYKNERTLKTQLEKLCQDHDFTKRFEKALKASLKGKNKGKKKRARALALKVVHSLDDKPFIRRADLIQRIEGLGYTNKEAEEILKDLHSSNVIHCSVGKYSNVTIA